MIATMVVLSLVCWGCWRLFRCVRSPQVAPILAAPKRPATRASTARGLEDDPDQWHPTRSAWTALDELQLTRLLRDSAPITGAATNPSDTAPHVEQGDAT